MVILVNLDQIVKVQSEVLKGILVLLDPMESQVGLQFLCLTKNKTHSRLATLSFFVGCPGEVGKAGQNLPVPGDDGDNGVMGCPGSKGEVGVPGPSGLPGVPGNPGVKGRVVGLRNKLMSVKVLKSSKCGRIQLRLLTLDLKA